MDVSCHQQSFYDYGVLLPAMNNVNDQQFQIQLNQHTGPESIPHIVYMIGIEERVLKFLRGEHLQRGLDRIFLYNECLNKIQNVAASSCILN